MDGPWQLGHVPAEAYAERALSAAQLMQGVDPTVETVVCGSSTPDLPSYLEWDRTVLECLGDRADYLSVHRYVNNLADDTPGIPRLGAQCGPTDRAGRRCVPLRPGQIPQRKATLHLLRRMERLVQGSRDGWSRGVRPT